VPVDMQNDIKPISYIKTYATDMLKCVNETHKKALEINLYSLYSVGASNTPQLCCEPSNNNAERFAYEANRGI
jgi:hypothetical protein